MMARTKRSRRFYSAGEWGRNRVRVFPDPKTGIFQIEWRRNGRRLTRSLKHHDWARAKRQADEVAAGFAVHEPAGKAEAEPEPLTLGTLLDIYGEEVTPAKAETSQRSDRAATKMFLQFFGRHRKPATLSQRDWDRFIRARRAGKIGPSGSPRPGGGAGEAEPGRMSGVVLAVGDLWSAERIHVAEGVAHALAIAAPEEGATLATQARPDSPDWRRTWSPSGSPHDLARRRPPRPVRHREAGRLNAGAGGGGPDCPCPRRPRPGHPCPDPSHSTTEVHPDDLEA